MIKPLKLSVKQAVHLFPELSEVLNHFVNDERYIVLYEPFQNVLEVGFESDQFELLK